MPVRMARGRLTPSSSSRLQPPAQGGRAGKQTDPFYLSAEWKAFRNQVIRERGWRCEDPRCGSPGGPWKQIYGDHIVERQDGGALFDRANIMLRCGCCHGRKTRDERARRAGLIDVLARTGGGLDP